MKKTIKLKSLISCIAIIFREKPFLASLEGLSYLGSAITTGFMPLVWAFVFQAIENYITGKKENSIIHAMILFLIVQLAEVLFRMIGRVPTRVFCYNEQLQMKLCKNIYLHATELPYEDFLNQEIYNSFARSNNSISRNLPMNLLNTFFQIPSLVLSLCVAIVTLGAFSRWLVLIAIVSLLPISIIQAIILNKTYDISKDLTPIKKATSYFYSLFTEPTAVAEFRTYGCEEYFKTSWEKSLDKENLIVKKHAAKSSLQSITGEAFKLLGFAVALIFSSIAVAAGSINLGVFGALLTAYNSMQTTLNQIVSSLLSINSTYLFYSDYESFLKKSICTIPVLCDKTIEEISFENVSYKYPHSSVYAVENLNLKLRFNESVAVVGENGSGKTTLCLLLLGLLQPTSGKVISTFSDGEKRENIILQRKIGTVFQDYVIYKLTLKENLLLANLHSQYESAVLEKTLQNLHFKDEETINLEETIGLEFGGVEYSGGERQKIALARAQLSKCNYIVMDEPTASLDPMMEFELLNNVLSTVENKGFLLITHRVGASRLTDQIIVLKNGKLVERGSHDELINLHGEYANLFKMQAKWYIDNEE